MTAKLPAFVTRLALPGALLAAMFTVGACTPAPSADNAEAEPAPAEAAPEIPEGERAPKIACDEAIFDFGGVTAHGSVEHVFKIKNVGTADLEIEQVKRT